MFGQSHPVRVNFQTAFVGTTPNYQLGVTVDRYLSFVRDVKQLRFTGFGIRQSVLRETFFSPNDQTVGFNQILQRRRREAGYLGINNQELIPHPITFIDATYPFFSAGQNSSRFVLDFGKTAFRLGVLYPYLDAAIGSFSDINGNTIVGEIKIEELGTIVLKSPLAGVELILANGNVDIIERYSNLVPNTPIASPEQQIVFSIKDGEAFSFLDQYAPYYKGIRLEYNSSPIELTVTLPRWFRGGHIRFESIEQEDSFLSTYLQLA
jgi:hypothetical protein